MDWKKILTILSILVIVCSAAVFGLRATFPTHETLKEAVGETKIYHDTDMKNHETTEALQRKLLAAEIAREIEALHHLKGHN